MISPWLFILLDCVFLLQPNICLKSDDVYHIQYMLQHNDISYMQMQYLSWSVSLCF